jgi:hypothetical protein
VLSTPSQGGVYIIIFSLAIVLVELLLLLLLSLVQQEDGATSAYILARRCIDELVVKAGVEKFPVFGLISGFYI